MWQLSLPGGPTIDNPDNFKFAGSNVMSVVSALLPYIMAIAGIVLFVMLLGGGFSLLTAAGNPESIKKGQGMIVSSLIGFAIVFLAFWMIQLLELMLGLDLGFGRP